MTAMAIAVELFRVTMAYLGPRVFVQSDHTIRRLWAHLPSIVGGRVTRVPFGPTWSLAEFLLAHSGNG